MKRPLKSLIVKVLAHQVKTLTARNKIKVVAVGGSIGKTSTKYAIAKALSRNFRVRFQEGNYNDPLTVPLIFFGVENPPNLFNPLAWLKIILSNQAKLMRPYPYDLVVVELGTDGPGQMSQFANYLKPDIGVLTAISPEHMEFFKTIEAVAEEELVLADLVKDIIVSIDDVPQDYLRKISSPITYGIDSQADYYIEIKPPQVTLHHDSKSWEIEPKLIGRHIQKSLSAAVAVADKLGVKIDQDFINNLESIEPVPGRMQILNAKNNAIIIDDTYNNVSAEPAIAALDVLYDWPAKRRIAVLGNMNELGEHAQQAHLQVGRYCDPQKLDQVLTIGPEANKYLKPAAEKAGCKVTSFDSPHQIGRALVNELQPGSVILIKGSQNRVFLEEAIKPLLADPADITKLVRQTPKWLKTKAAQFKDSI
jgi:UDP-N-acetylmuramoyl-tripeptide--D-alanyl-D-alanine ligase